MKETDVIETPNDQIKNKKRKKKLIVGGILILIAIAIGLYIGYQKLNSNPISIYKNGINDLYSSLNDALKETRENSIKDLDIANDPFEVSIDMKLDSNMEELKNFTGLNYAFQMGIDNKNQIYNLGLGIKENNDSIISGILSVNSNHLYLQSKEVLDKVLDFGEIEALEDLFFQSSLTIEDNQINYSSEDFDYILKEMKNILIDSLDKKYFTMEEATITIDKKEYKTKKVTYLLNKENMERTTEFVRDQILKDEKLLQAIANLFGMTSSELETNLKEELDYSDFSDIKIVLYADMFNNVMAGDITVDKIEILHFENKNLFNMTITIDEDEMLIQEEEKTINIEFYENDIKLMKLKINKDNSKNSKIEYEINVEGVNINGVFEISDINVTDTSYKSNLKITVNVDFLGEEINLSLDGTIALEKKDIEAIDSSNSKSIDQLTEEDYLNIYSKLQTVLEKLGISDLLTSM